MQHGGDGLRGVANLRRIMDANQRAPYKRLFGWCWSSWASLHSMQQPRISFGVCTLLAATGRAHGKPQVRIYLTIVAPFLRASVLPTLKYHSRYHLAFRFQNSGHFSLRVQVRYLPRLIAYFSTGAFHQGNLYPSSTSGWEPRGLEASFARCGWIDSPLQDSNY